MRQWFLRTSSGAALKFQRPGQLLQDWITIFSVVWLVVGNSEGKERFCSQLEVCGTHDLGMLPQSIIISSSTSTNLIIFHSIASCNALAGLCISSTPCVFTLRSQLSYITSHLLHFQTTTICIYKCMYEPECQQLNYTYSQAWYVIIKLCALKSD